MLNYALTYFIDVLTLAALSLPLIHKSAGICIRNSLSTQSDPYTRKIYDSPSKLGGAHETFEPPT